MHIEIHAAGGGDLRKAAVFFLRVADIVFEFAREGKIVEEITGRFQKDLRVAEPAVALPRGAVRRQVGAVVFGGPAGGVHETVQKLIGGDKRPGLLQIGIHGDGRHVVRRNGDVRFDLRVLKAENGKSGFVFVYAVLADIFYSLQGRRFLSEGQLDVFLVQLAVLQQLAEAERNLLPGFGVHLK